MQREFRARCETSIAGEDALVIGFGARMMRMVLSSWRWPQVNGLRLERRSDSLFHWDLLTQSRMPEPELFL